MNMNDVNVGDSVHISGGFGHGRSVKKVTRITAKQFLVGTVRFWKERGAVVGGGTWNCSYARYATEEDRAEIKKSNLRITLRKKIRDTKFSDLPTDTLQAIVSAIVLSEGGK